MSERIRLEAKRDGIEISKALGATLSDLSKEDARFIELSDLLEAQGGPNDVNLPLQHELYKCETNLAELRGYSQALLGRAAARKAASVGFIGDMPSSARLYVSY